ncbi:hypothetical protein BUALT_Bualt11G0024500 [Buddleja alternifolia]|uniref:Protein kinase domain-containing protein n=1 Tax=Buddleja alternifolia TaxID=168488 RepID=A0AAV6X2R7_9LAMI|nr:hypothetical protein BUALT_Bualt11G0024500 [Buddleja alternifolia]
MIWKRGRKIGSGAFGSVYIGVRDESKIPLMAVKSAEFSRSKTLKKEAELLLNFELCPHIIDCYGADESVEHGERLYNVFLEYAPRGSLADYIEKSKIRGGLHEDKVKKHTRSLLLGLSFIHNLGYIHRDINPSNILIDSKGNAKIADFGLAKKYRKKSEKKRSKGCIGTILYMAPEIIEKEVYEPPVDIWALGCTVVEMITGKPVWDFPDADPFVVMFTIMSVGMPEIPKGLSEEAEDFVRRCLVVDPEKRWTAEMLLDHPFVASMEEGKLIPCNGDMPKSACNGGFKNWTIGCC